MKKKTNQTFILFTYGEMEKENKKAEWKQQYQKRKGYFKEYYQKHKDVMNANNKKNAKKYREEYKHLKEENKKLDEAYQIARDRVIELLGDIEQYLEHIKELEEENKNLKSDLDKYKHYYDRDKEELMESCYGLSKENKKLKSDLSECECSFGFESDEVGFWKREYKRLKKWIKDHCNGYGNLFPEDEMKRQWKKADKKRKLKSTYVYDAKQVRDIC